MAKYRIAKWLADTMTDAELREHGLKRADRDREAASRARLEGLAERQHQRRVGDAALRSMGVGPKRVRPEIIPVEKRGPTQGQSFMSYLGSEIRRVPGDLLDAASQGAARMRMGFKGALSKRKGT